MDKKLNKCEFTQDPFPLSHAAFQCCHRQHLLHCPTTRSVEGLGVYLRQNQPVPVEMAADFIEMVCSWGGRTGARVHGLTMQTPGNTKAQVFTNVIMELNQGNWASACSVLMAGGIKGLGSISYASKMLRMLDPAHCAVLDSKLSEYLVRVTGTSLRRYALWQCYSLYCINKSKELTAAGVLLGDYIDDCNDSQVIVETDPNKRTLWTAGDVDMAVFAWLNGWCRSDVGFDAVSSSPAKGPTGKPLVYSETAGFSRLVLYSQENKAGTISIKADCHYKQNLAWIDNGNLNFKDSTVAPYLLELIQLASDGQNLRRLGNWSNSPNGQTNYGYSSHYEGWLKLKDNAEAMELLTRYFEVHSCKEI